MIIKGRNQINQSFIIKSLKPQYYKEYTARFQMSDCFRNFTNETIVFAHYIGKYI